MRFQYITLHIYYFLCYLNLVNLFKFFNSDLMIEKLLLIILNFQPHAYIIIFHLIFTYIMRRNLSNDCIKIWISNQ